MKHENFPPIPSSYGSFFGSADLKTEVLDRIAETPDKYFIRGQYVRPRSAFSRSAELWGLKGPPRYIKGCAVIQLAFAGHVEENISTLDMFSENSDLAMEAIKLVLRERFGFPFALTQAISTAYESVGNKMALYLIVDAIPVGATYSLHVTLQLYERARKRNEGLRRDLLLIRALKDHEHFARPSVHSFV